MPWVTIDGGSTLHYQERGSGPVVLCLQGVGVVGNGWRPQLDGLGDAFHLIAPDNRGIGHSALGDDPVSVAAYARDARRLLDALDIERAHVMGHSLGGAIAQQLALDAPDRIESLAMLCTFHRASDGARLTPRNLWTGLRNVIGTKRMRRAAFLSNVLPAEVLRQVDIDELHAKFSPLFGRDLATLPPIVMKQVRALGAYDGSEHWAALRTIATLVLAGAHDVIAPPAQGQAIADATSGRYVEFSDAAHGLPITHAKAVNALLREHWTRGPAPAEPRP